MRARKKTPHVLVIPSWYPTPEDATSGIFFRDQAIALASCGVNVGVVSVERRTARQLSVSAVRASHWQAQLAATGGVDELRLRAWSVPPRSLGDHLWMRSTRKLVSSYVKQFGLPDVIHAHSVLLGGVVAHAVADVMGVPYFITEHLSSFLRDGWAPRSSLACLDAMRHAAGAAAVSAVLSQVVGAWAGRDVRVIPNVVDTEFFREAAMRPYPSTFRIVTAGYLIERKAVHVQLHAFAQAFGARGNATLTIIGDGPERPRLQALATSLGIKSVVEFTGMQSRSQIRAALSDCRCFVLSSRRETFGVVLAEALAAGVPIVSTDSGGPTDIVSSGVGELVPVDDVGALAEALIRTSNRNVTDRMYLHEYATSRFGARVVGRQLLDMYAADA